MVLFFVKFTDGALYATGDQGDIPGGPIAYESLDDANEMARAIEGSVVQRTSRRAIDFCLEKGYTLWIKKELGGMVYIEETIPKETGPLERVEGEERQAAIAASRQLHGSEMGITESNTMCKHLNCEVREEFLVHDVIFVRDGQVDHAQQDLEHPLATGRYFVKCYDCGMEKGFGSHRPRWLDQILDKAMTYCLKQVTT